MLQSSESYHHALHKSVAGVVFDNVSFDLKKIHKHKDGVVGQLTDGVEYLLKKNKVKYIKGIGSFDGPGKVKVTSDEVSK